MHNIIFPSKDTTIYSEYPEINTGLDEILEISKEISSSNYFYRGPWIANTYYKRREYVSGSDGYYYALAENVGEETSSAYWQLLDATAATHNSRILIKFDLSNLTAETSASASVVYLNLFTSIARKIPMEYTLNAHPMLIDWEMGIGNFTDKLTKDGATWIRSSSIGEWANDGAEGNYLAGTIASQSFNFAPTDVRMDITNIFNYWSSSVNNGIIIKRPELQELNRTRYGSLSFYSLDTHTVYVPTLEVCYDDHIYNTSSFISSSTYQSASFLTNTITTESVAVLNNFIYYMSASVSQSLVNIISTGIYGSSSLLYITMSITGSEALRNIDGDWYLSSVPVAYQSASIEYSLIGLQALDTYYSASYNFISQSVKNDSLLYSTQSFISSSVQYATVSQSTIISSSLLSGSVSISMKNFMPEYKYNTKVRFRINAKNSYIAKTFYEELRPGITYYLPDTVYYSIVDAYSNRIMIPFSDYTRVSLDETGHFFDVSLSGFMPERFYKIIFKVTIDGAIQYFDTDNQFKVVK